MSKYFGLYPNRTACAVLDEMRNLDKTKNYGALAGLIEELQILANRMEAGLSDKHDIVSAQKHIKELKKEIEELNNKKEALNE